MPGYWEGLPAKVVTSGSEQTLTADCLMTQLPQKQHRNRVMVEEDSGGTEKILVQPFGRDRCTCHGTSFEDVL